MSETERHETPEPLAEVRERLLAIGVVTEGMLRDAIQALTQQDSELARASRDREAQIEALDIQIEAACLKLMARRIADPTQRRLVGGALKIVADIVQIAGYAADIAKVAQRMNEEVIYKPLVDIPRLGNLARTMLRDALDAFVHNNLSSANLLLNAEDEADALYARMRRELASVLRRDPESVIQASHLILVAHYLERVCDHCAHIARTIHFLITGQRDAAPD